MNNNQNQSKRNFIKFSEIPKNIPENPKNGFKNENEPFIICKTANRIKFTPKNTTKEISYTDIELGFKIDNREYPSLYEFKQLKAPYGIRKVVKDEIEQIYEYDIIQNISLEDDDDLINELECINYNASEAFGFWPQTRSSIKIDGLKTKDNVNGKYLRKKGLFPSLLKYKKDKETQTILEDDDRLLFLKLSKRKNDPTRIIPAGWETGDPFVDINSLVGQPFEYIPLVKFSYVSTVNGAGLKFKVVSIIITNILPRGQPIYQKITIDELKEKNTFDDLKLKLKDIGYGEEELIEEKEKEKEKEKEEEEEEEKERRRLIYVANELSSDDDD